MSQVPELHVEMPKPVDAMHQEQLEDPMEDEQQIPAGRNHEIMSFPTLRDQEDVEHGGS